MTKQEDNDDRDVKHEPEQLRKMFIGGLDYGTNDDGLKSYYEQWGTVVDVVVMKDPKTKRSRGFGFITYSKASMVDDAMANRPHKIDGRQVEPKRAVPRDLCGKGEANVRKLFIGGIGKQVTKEDLEEYFGKYGKMTDCAIVVTKDTGEPRGFGFVEYEDVDAADKVILLRDHEIKGRRVDIKKAIARDDMGRGDNRGGGGGDRRNDRGGRGGRDRDNRGGGGDYRNGQKNFGGGGGGGGWNNQGNNWGGGNNNNSPWNQQGPDMNWNNGRGNWGNSPWANNQNGFGQGYNNNNNSLGMGMGNNMGGGMGGNMGGGMGGNMGMGTLGSGMGNLGGNNAGMGMGGNGLGGNSIAPLGGGMGGNNNMFGGGGGGGGNMGGGGGYNNFKGGSTGGPMRSNFGSSNRSGPYNSGGSGGNKGGGGGNRRGGRFN